MRKRRRWKSKKGEKYYIMNLKKKKEGRGKIKY
jgi:hypothetical protein